jgi:hypothetical protein
MFRFLCGSGSTPLITIKNLMPWICALCRRAEADEPGEPGREEEEGRAQRCILPHGQVTPVTRAEAICRLILELSFCRSAAMATCRRVQELTWLTLIDSAVLRPILQLSCSPSADACRHGHLPTSSGTNRLTPSDSAVWRRI